MHILPPREKLGIAGRAKVVTRREEGRYAKCCGGKKEV